MLGDWSALAIVEFIHYCNGWSFVHFVSDYTRGTCHSTWLVLYTFLPFLLNNHCCCSTGIIQFQIHILKTLRQTPCRNSVNTKVTRSFAYAQAANNKAVLINDASMTSIVRRDEPPVAWTSNGDPPPESWFESCGCCGRPAADEAGGCTSPVGDTPEIDVGSGSTIRPCEEDADDCAATDDCVFSVVVPVTVVVEGAGGGVEVVVLVLEVAACVLLVCAAVVLDEVVDDVAGTSTPGHNDRMPLPARKTPMILFPSTRMPLQALFTSSVISCSPCTHAELQRAFPPKSLAWQPLMVVVYADSHCALGMLLMRGVKLERDTVADVPVMRSATLNAMVRKEVCMTVYKYSVLFCPSMTDKFVCPQAFAIVNECCSKVGRDVNVWRWSRSV
jgi:hypothetical protein